MLGPGARKQEAWRTERAQAGPHPRHSSLPPRNPQGSPTGPSIEHCAATAGLHRGLCLGSRCSLSPAKVTAPAL